MKITRRGARADNGPSSISLDNIRITRRDEGVLLEDRDIADFVTKAHYNYKIVLSFDEIAGIVDALGDYTSEQKKSIGKAFEPKLKKLLRIVQACIDE